MPNTIDQKLFDCLTQLNEIEKKSVLMMLQNYINGSRENLDNISLQQYNKELEEAEAEFERGDYITHEELLRQIKQW